MLCKAERPLSVEWRSSETFVLSTAAISLFTDTFLYGLIVPVSPFLLENDAGVPRSQIQTYTSAMLAAYAGATVVSSPLSGILADRTPSRRGLFLFALVCLMSATILLFLSRAITIMVLARILQGIACAFVWTMAMVICLDTVGAARMGSALGTIFSAVQVGTLIAPVIGGVLYKESGMQGVMALAIALLTVDLLMRLFAIEKKIALQAGWVSDNRLDPSMRTTERLGNEGYMHDEEPLLQKDNDLDDRYKLSEEQPRIVHAIPYLACLASPSLRTALLASTIHGILIGSFDSTIATVAQSFFRFDSSQAGLLYLPIGLAGLVSGPIIGWAVDCYGTKKPAVFAFAIMAPVLILLRLVQPGGIHQVVLYAALLSFAGIGLSGCATPALVEGGNVIERYHTANPTFFGENGPYAMVYGVNGAVFNAGMTIGPTIAGGLKESIGYGNMNLVLAGVSGFTALLCWKYLGSSPRRETLVRH
ncbi:hypothetical protein CKM354_001293900 [Cercospora kikuchii]|uniref:Major facilitator superfamily (MFS) profile domain-containing protein n=1 Tax=Cercospora kikuchii TaxID=84275 RepID=A0A9P3FMZ7_9PEZI|nr:uncharacterized protein CKM354_001293900 [Cercospora kikuchii]GIZ49922.1 hypothetical protein CKM354_001293900 [Cercospora kikuchii]